MACKHLGYDKGIDFTTKVVHSEEIAIDYIFCLGSENSLYSCSYFHMNICESLQAVVVNCA